MNCYKSIMPGEHRQIEDEVVGREGMKIGRNEPCPCGSGKKYKKCCGLKSEPEFGLPEDLLTGTPLDEYMTLTQPVAMYALSLMELDRDGKELKKVVSEFEKDLQPGEPGGILDSHFLSWLHFDVTFGKAGKTVAERFLELPEIRKLNEPGPTFIRQMAESYAAFYQITGIERDVVHAEELGTGRQWTINRIGGGEEEVFQGDVWYVRLVGTPLNAYAYTTPYVWDADARNEFESATIKLIEKTREKTGLTGDALFRKSLKDAFPLWAYYITEGLSQGADESRLPAMHNTDGDPIIFCKLYFTIHKRAGLEDLLSGLKDVDYDEENKTWVWLKKKKKGSKLVLGTATTLGTITIKRKYLVAETNSENRADIIIDKLEKELKGAVSYKKAEYRNIDDILPLSDEERQKADEAHKKLMAQPEVQKVLGKMIADYYLKEWIKEAIPALGGKTPLEAAKTEKGKQQLRQLIDGFDQRHTSMPPDSAADFDFDKLRKKLGLK
ncbi:MAG: hypothetical protein A4E57_01397 [Syntrophorhabdaceae bacterium PtaU1.Bin034]|nr:MAG: hypothetical protein A4E57_01397 [Syntrophorhabdaceae bacterium PtaU1.Bin034]